MNLIQDNILDIAIYSGIYLSSSDQNMVMNNSITNSSSAIKLFSSSFDTLLDNKITNSGISLDGNGLLDFNTHSIDTSNTVNGKPLYYWKNVTGGTMPLGGGQVILANCSGVTVANQSIMNTYAAILIVYSSDLTIVDNYMTNNSYGVDIDLSDRITLDNNTFINSMGYGLYISRSNENNITSNTIYDDWNGISIIFSDNNIISNNNVSNNKNDGIRIPYSNNNIILNNSVYSNTNYSLYLNRSNNNRIENNTLSLSNYGIFVDGRDWDHATGNIIKGNTISSNSAWGLNFTSYTENNKIYHNQIINNSFQAIDNGANQWDDGYPSGGNYWSDYVGFDFNSTPSQNVSPSDGIGDTPFLIDLDSQDNYPLMPMNLQCPMINLLSPNNNSIFLDGRIIDLDITDRSEDIVEVNYSLNSGMNQPLSYPYDIDTTGWSDGISIIEIHAIDDDGNTATESYIFTIDSTTPLIFLNSPANNSLIPAGTILDFNVSDPHLNIVNYSVNGTANLSFPAPYDIDTAGWADGLYVIEIHANDTAGNNVSRSYNFIIDSTAPLISLNSPTNNSIIMASTIIDIGVSDANNVSVNYSVNGDSDTSLPAPYDIDTTSWIDGTYTIEVHAIDDAGNTATEIYEFTIDFTAPAIILNSPENNSIIAAGKIIDIGVSDVNNISVNYSVNGGSNISLPAPYDIDTTSWTDGTYTIEIHAMDDAGNTAFETYEFTIDSTSPVIIINSPANNSVIPAGTILDFNVSDPHLNIVNYSVNSAANLSFPAPYDIDTAVWADGLYVIKIHANDTAGNDVSRSYNFIIDSTAPLISLNSPTNDSIIVAGTIIDIGVSDVNNISVNYSINGGLDTGLPAPYDINTNGWTDGTYTFEIHAMDAAGNTATEICEFTIDSTSPVIIINFPANNSVIPAGTILDFNVSDPHLNIVNYSVNGAANLSFPAPYNIDTTGWPDGIYLVEIHANDTVRNHISRSYSFIIDSTAPVITLNSPTNNSLIKASTVIYIGVSDANNVSVNYSLNGGSNTSLPAPYDINTTGWSDGTYTIEVHAIDEAGNTAIKIYEFMVDSTPPAIALNSPVNNSVIPAGTILDFNVSDLHLDIVNYSVNGGPIQTLTPSYDIDTTGWSDGLYSIEVHAIDDAGNTAVEIYEFTIDSTPPAITLNSSANNSVIPAGTMLDFDVSEPHLNIVNYSINGGANTNFPAPYDIDTTGWSDGLYVIEVHANDSVGNNASRSYNFIIDSTNPVIILNSPVNDTIILPGTIIDINVIDDNIDVVDYSVNGGSIQTLISPLYDIGTTGWPDGTYIIEINAIDDAGNTAVEIYEFMIDTTIPTVDAGPDITTNTQFFQNATANDTTSGIATYNWTKLSGPGIITFGNASAEDTIISADQDGTYVIQLNVTDNAGNWAISNFTLIWDTTPPAIVVSNAMNCSGIWFNVTDDNLDFVYYLNGTSNTTSISPYFIDTSVLASGWYNYTIWAFDSAGNSASGRVMVYIEPEVAIIPIPPTITGTTPENGAVNVSTATDITITFSQPMDITSVQSALGMTNLTSNMGMIFFWNADNTTLTLSLSELLDPETPYTVIIDTWAADTNGTTMADEYRFSFTTFVDTDEDGIPDSDDSDKDGDGIPNSDDAFPLDPGEATDSDGDGIGNNADPDDDNDGVPDDIDSEPSNPDVDEVIDEPETPSNDGNYLWIIIILIIAAILGAAFMLARKKPLPVIEEEAIMETELCPKCGFEIEKGSACPFCVETIDNPEPQPVSKPPEPKPAPKSEPPKPAEVPKPKPKFSNEEMLEKIEKSYREGKLSEEQYLKNMKKFS